MLPADADPMDARYNLISWVHRSTRGWSYGGGITDPRTGEIIKGNVTLGSLRVRQDYMIGQGLDSVVRRGRWTATCLIGMMAEDDYIAQLDPSTDITAMSLARIRQLAAHEVGHTLGFAHNFAASTYGRGSVMDYPAPWVDIKDGKLDLSNAYATGIGVFDKFAATVRLQRSSPPAPTRRRSSRRSSRTASPTGCSTSRTATRARPTRRIRSRASGTAAAIRSPRSKHEMDVRRIGLAKFGLTNIPIGTPLSELERQLLPLYLHHRYQLQSAVKSLGGVYFTYAVRTALGPNPPMVAQIVPPAIQRAALDAVLSTITVDTLRIPDAGARPHPAAGVRLRRQHRPNRSPGGPIRRSIQSAPPRSPPTSPCRRSFSRSARRA